MKHHLKQPFFSKLHNQFVYLAQDDEWFSKVYYRSIAMYYKLLGNFLSIKFEELKMDRAWFGIRKKRGSTTCTSGCAFGFVNDAD